MNRRFHACWPQVYVHRSNGGCVILRNICPFVIRPILQKRESSSVLTVASWDCSVRQSCRAWRPHCCRTNWQEFSTYHQCPLADQLRLATRRRDWYSRKEWDKKNPRGFECSDVHSGERVEDVRAQADRNFGRCELEKMKKKEKNHKQ